MTCVALIPARGGSKGIPRKNIKFLNSKPLIYWSIKVALESSRVDRVIVSTEDEEIADLARSFSAEVPFLRPKKFSKDNSSGLEPIMHALEKIPDIKDLLLLQPTSPLRRLEDIEGIFEKRSIHNADSAVSLTPSKKNLDLFFQIDKNMKIISDSNNLDIKPRQQYLQKYHLNGSLYLSTRESILKNKSLITQDTIGYIMPEEFSIDIDTPLDWVIAEHLMVNFL
ncbi:acylneuraminate cytidylyltransferase family protein [Prochlorococcus sp. AH-716-E13]|nr:acylneuraminate cytidylyltransferase family protein [Prochlorococcus sp. AH-716-E13]